MITRNFKLFLNAGKQIPLMINVSQYDHGEKWVFTLYDDNGQKYTPSTGAIVGIKADNKGIINTGTVNSAGQVEIMETQQMTAAAGKAVFELLIDGDTHGTANFIVLVEPKPGDQADMSTSDLSLLQQAINSIAIAGSGAPAVATLAADMTDEGKIYLYAGSEVGYTAGDWYYYNGASWVDGGKYGGTVDATLTQPGQAADAKKVGDEINDLKSQIGGGGLTADIKSALMNVVNHIGVWTDGNAQTYIGALQTALYPPANLTSISAVFTQGNNVIYDTDSLDTLKQYLVVTAHYSDSTTETLADSAYTLSGTLTEGTSTITVSYGGKTTTFNVTVSVISWTVEWDYEDGLPENNGFTKSTNTGASTSMQNDGLLMATTSSSASATYVLTSESTYTPCTETVLEAVINLQELASLSANSSSYLKGCAFLVYNGASATNVSITSLGLSHYYNGAWHVTDAQISLNTDYTIRIETGYGTTKLYLDGVLVSEGTISTATTITATKIYQHQGGSTIHKSWKIRYEQ